jgi:hypothetical protein
MDSHDHNLQNILDMIKRPTLRIPGVEEGTEVQTKDTENLFNEIITENF